MSLFQICAIVASNAAQASQIKECIDRRREAGLYPREIEFHVLCDPEHGRVGSGGATLMAACALRDRLLVGDSVMVVNAGGESRRMPTYAPEGKLFAPLPLPSSSRIPPVLLDAQLGLFIRYPWNRGEMVVTSGDVAIDFDVSTVPRDRGDVYGFAKTDSFELGSQHGVFKFDKNRSQVVDFFQKRDVDFLREQASLEGSRSCALDTGIVGFSRAGVERLLSLAEGAAPTGGTVLASVKEGRVRFDLYVELLMAFLAGVTFEKYCEKVRGQSNLDTAFLRLIHAAFETVDFRAFLTRQTQFLHFGSLHEYPQSCEVLATAGVLPFYAGEDAELRPFLPESIIQFNSTHCTLSPIVGAKRIYVESCSNVHLESVEGDHLVVGLRGRTFSRTLARGICLEERQTEMGRFLLVYGQNDTWRPQARPHDITYCGVSLAQWASERSLAVETLLPCVANGRKDTCDLWDAALFLADVDESFTEGYWDARVVDAQWTARFREARKFSIREVSASESLGKREARRSEIRQELLRDSIAGGHGWLSISEWDFRHALRGSDVSSLRGMCEASDDDLVKIYRRKLLYSISSGAAESDSIVGLGLDYMASKASAMTLRRSVKRDQIVWARSPVRLDLAGGWTDTPPFTLREGGEVVNVAIDLNDQPPIQVFCRPTTESRIRIHSIDLGVSETITHVSQLESFNRPGSPFALAKAALCLLGFTADGTRGESLERVLEIIGCGFEITLLSAVPKGSGLGTSSILGATILGALERFFGLHVTRDQLILQVLQTEQMLTTGGGWQDQIGGIVGGVKYISTTPGLRPKPSIYQLDPYIFEAAEYASRFTLYYTGITRLAKNILQDVVDCVNSLEPAYLFTLRHLKQLAKDGREAISQRDMDALCQVLRGSWKENKLIHPSTTNEEVETLLHANTGLFSGMKLLGAGGGGFALFLSDSTEMAYRLRDHLSNMESERARVVDMAINSRGLHVTVS